MLRCQLNNKGRSSTNLNADVVIFIFCLFENIGEAASEALAPERKIKNVCRHLWEKRGLLSPSLTSTPHHYHLTAFAVPIKWDQ